MEDRAWKWHITDGEGLNLAHGTTDTLSETIEQMKKAKDQLRRLYGPGIVLKDFIGKYSLNG